MDAVLLVTQQLRTTRSGTGLYARLLALEFVRRGVPFSIATWTDEIDAEAFPDVPVVDLGTPPGWDPTPGAFVALGRRLGERDPGGHRLIHFTDAREAHGYLARVSAPTAKLVGTVHDDYAAGAHRSPFGFVGRAADPYKRWLYYTWLRRIERKTYRRLAGLMVNADATGRSVAEQYDLDAARFETVALCCAPNSPTTEDPPPLPGSPALLFAGGNFFRKGLDTVVRALPAVLAAAPDAHLHVAGHDRAAGAIERMAETAGVRSALTLHGRVPRERMAEMMAAADAFVMPSRTEALGLVYLEAMRSGTPVVSGNVGGVTEIVRDGETGLTVPPEDPASLASAVLRLHADPALARRLVEAGRALDASRTPERLADETLAAYEPVR